MAVARKLTTALHELGHTLGFTHPEQGTLISGTLADTTPGGAASYPTVMAIDLGGVTSLSADDIAARDRLFSAVGGVCPDGVVSIAN